MARHRPLSEQWASRIPLSTKSATREERLAARRFLLAMALRVRKVCACRLQSYYACLQFRPPTLSIACERHLARLPDLPRVGFHQAWE